MKPFTDKLMEATLTPHTVATLIVVAGLSLAAPAAALAQTDTTTTTPTSTGRT